MSGHSLQCPQLRAASPAICCHFFVARTKRLAGQDTEGLPARLLSEPPLPPPILGGVIGDAYQPASRCESRASRLEERLECLDLLVDRDTQGLKRAGRGIDGSPPGGAQPPMHRPPPGEGDAHPRKSPVPDPPPIPETFQSLARQRNRGRIAIQANQPTRWRSRFQDGGGMTPSAHPRAAAQP